MYKMLQIIYILNLYYMFRQMFAIFRATTADRNQERTYISTC